MMSSPRSLSSLWSAIAILLIASPAFAQQTEPDEPAPADGIFSPEATAGDITLAQRVDPERERARRARRNQPRPTTRRPPAKRPPSNRRPPSRRRAPVKRCPPRVTVPVDVGIGPTFNFISGPVQQDQLVHFGGRLNFYAVVTRKFLRKNWACVPQQYRKYARNVTEARIKPIYFNLLPRELIISPKIPDQNDTGIYGIGWNLFSLGLAPIQDPFRVSFSFGLPVKYMFIHSDTLPGPTHFLRPGLEGMLDIEIPFTERFLFSFGWASQVFVPQRVGGMPWEFGPLDQSIWHVGQAFFKLHFRVPYETSI